MIVQRTNDDQAAIDSTIEAVLEAVGREADCDPLELPPLWNAIDPEALEALFAPTRSGVRRCGRVAFAYCDYEVTVEVDRDGTRNVSVEVLDNR